MTPDRALTTVDLPCATCPMVPTLMVAWRLHSRFVVFRVSGCMFCNVRVLMRVRLRLREQCSEQGVAIGCPAGPAATPTWHAVREVRTTGWCDDGHRKHTG